MIRFSGVHKRFGAVEALRGVDFEAGDGAITVLLGPNGAGKSSCLKILAGLSRADAGQVTRRAPDGAARRPGLLMETYGLPPRLAAAEYLWHIACLHGMQASAVDAAMHALTDELGLAALLHRRMDGFSQGERMKLALAGALIHAPHDIVLDEPTNALDVVSVRSVRTLLRARALDAACC